jgi:hypothetical protein
MASSVGWEFPLRPEVIARIGSELDLDRVLNNVRLVDPNQGSQVTTPCSVEVDEGAIEVAMATTDEVAAVEQATEEEGVAEDAKIAAEQEPTEEEAEAEDGEQEHYDEEDASDEEEQQLDLDTIDVDNIDLSLLIKGKADTAQESATADDANAERQVYTVQQQVSPQEFQVCQQVRMSAQFMFQTYQIRAGRVITV